MIFTHMYGEITGPIDRTLGDERVHNSVKLIGRCYST